MDRILAYMYLMLDEAHIHRQPIRRSDFVALGKDLKLYDGVEGGSVASTSSVRSRA